MLLYPPEGGRIMTQSKLNIRDHEWFDYYERFSYFSAGAVRDGCQPRIMEHEDPPGKAIVLVHGLTDSPYFMTAIGDYFFHNLGYDVYLPLLHCHGLKEPKGMEGVKLEEWKANVNFAVDTAASRAGHVAVGGLSTGGTLSFYTAVNNRKITGALYLFSAALDLASGIAGELKERILRTFLADILDMKDNNKPLIGVNPYRYARIDLDGAQELSRLIKETDALTRKFSPKKPFSKTVFAAHSESDTTASITGIEDLEKISQPGRFTFFRIPGALGVAHASVVLKDPIYAADAADGEEPLEKANPQFPDMMEATAAVS
jgi:pimeloyl-ACP methyl ester carboxylesterase